MNPITRRPFLLLSIFIAGAALLQAVVGANSPTTAGNGKLPAGMVCTTCGPIYSASAPQLVMAPGVQP
jgi:hypothetical protein